MSQTSNWRKSRTLRLISSTRRALRNKCKLRNHSTKSKRKLATTTTTAKIKNCSISSSISIRKTSSWKSSSIKSPKKSNNYSNKYKIKNNKYRKCTSKEPQINTTKKNWMKSIRKSFNSTKKKKKY